MKRRDFVSSVLAAGIAAPVVGATGKAPAAQDHSGHGGNGDTARLRNVTIAFGNWGPTIEQPYDRFANANDRTRNVHRLVPNPAKVHVGDTVSFLVSGFHNPQVFGPGTQPSDINTNLVVPGSAPAIIDDPTNRVFRGINPATAGLQQDRTENISFTAPGRYLVICGVKVHFVDAAGNFIMFGYIDVTANDD
jgi:hypothetical protein